MWMHLISAIIFTRIDFWLCEKITLSDTEGRKEKNSIRKGHILTKVCWKVCLRLFWYKRSSHTLCFINSIRPFFENNFRHNFYIWFRLQDMISLYPTDFCNNKCFNGNDSLQFFTSILTLRAYSVFLHWQKTFFNIRKYPNWFIVS